MIALTPSLLTSSLTSLLVNMQMNQHCVSGPSSTWWPFCAEVVSDWLQASSFGLLLLLLLERSLGNKGIDARGVSRGRRGEAQLSLPLASLHVSRQ